ncbi:hypothetical protein [Kitasatospora sp. NPDC056531]|uniref:hypothetical protein n=1 Tax=Kitasatospora sp. NPDC056531 TaxID=3345856 RepID=UPI0036D0C321
MTDITTEQAETYLTAVEDRLTSAGLRPALLDLHQHDKYDETGDTIPSAVLTWPAEHPLVNTDVHEHGLLVAWAPARGWVHASLRPDGSNEQLQHVATDNAEPDQVTAGILTAALGLPANADEQAITAAIITASHGVKHGTPTYQTCTCHKHPCGGVGWDRIDPDCPDHGQKNPCLMWHWAACCPAN